MQNRQRSTQQQSVERDVQTTPVGNRYGLHTRCKRGGHMVPADLESADATQLVLQTSHETSTGQYQAPDAYKGP